MWVKKGIFFFPSRVFAFPLRFIPRTAERRSGPLRHSQSPQREPEETPSDLRELSERDLGVREETRLPRHLFCRMASNLPLGAEGKAKERREGRNGGTELWDGKLLLPAQPVCDV